MKWTDEKRAVIAMFAVALGALLLVGVLSYRTTTDLIKAAASRHQANLVLDKLQSLLSELHGVESSQRAYLITGAESELESYRAAVSKIHLILKDLRDLTEAHPRQKQNLAALEPTIVNNLTELQQTIDLRKEKGFGPAREAVLAGKGKQPAEEIQKVIADSAMREDELVSRRDEEMKANARNSLIMQFVGTSLGCVLLVAVFIMLSREISRRTQAENELRALARQQAAIAGLGQVALAGVDLNQLMDEAVSVVARTLGVEYCKILELLPCGRSLLVRAGLGWREGTVGHAIVGTDAGSQAGYTLLSHEPVAVEDLRTETRFHGPPLLVEHNVVSGLSVIIPGSQRPFGILGAHTSRRRAFNKDDVNFLQAIAHTLAAAIERKRAEEMLRQQAQVLAQIHDSVVSTDLEGIVKSWNQGAVRLSGYSPEEALGQHISFMYPADQQEFLSQEVIEPLKAKGVHEIEVRMQKKSGVEFYAHLSLSLLRDNQGSVIGMIGYSMDITERKRAEEAVARSEARLQLQIARMPIAYILWDPTFHVASWNPAAEAIFGYRADEAIGRHGSFLLPEDAKRHVGEIYHRLLQGDAGAHSINDNLTKDGRRITCDWSNTPIKETDGSVVGILSMVQDITERKRAEEARRESEERFRQMAENVQEVFWMTNATGTEILYVNPAYENIWGRSCESLCKNPLSWLDPVHPEDRARVLGGYREQMAKGQFKAEFRIERPDGSVRWIWDRSFPIQDETGQIRRIVGIAEDITERKRAEEALRMAIEDLQREMNDRIAAEEVSRGQTEVLVHMLNLLTTEPDLRRFKGQALCAVANAFKAHSSSLWLNDPATRTASLDMTCYLGEDKCQMLTGERQLDHPNAGEPVQVTPGSPLEHFYKVREPFVFKDPGNSSLLKPEVRLWAAAHGIRSILSIPLLFGDELVGILTIRDTQRDEFTPREISLAQALGHHVTLTMELTRLAEHEQQSAVLQERNRMAQEIHDTLAQGLAGIVIQLEAAEDVLSGSPDDARAHLGRARTLARESLGEARRSVWALRPQALESGDLATALRHFAGQLTMGTPIPIEFSQRGTPCRLPPEAEFHLLRIAQEALTNAVNHAQAGKIRVELVYDAQGVQLSVQDDGRGFGPRQQGSNRGFGIISMNERAERVGAQLTIFSEPGLGTRVVAMLPTRADSSGGVPR